MRGIEIAGDGGGGDGRRRASRWETATAVAQSRWVTATAVAAQWKARRRRDHDAWHRDCGGRRQRRWATAAQWAAGRQGVHSSAGRWDSPSYLLDFNERDIPHTTEIHKQVGEPKKVRKKVQLFVFRKR